MSSRRRGVEPWPWIVAGLLAVMIAGSLAFYRIAAANPDPLVVDDAWRAGRGYSERLRAARRAEALGWAVDLATRPSADGVRVQVALRGGPDGRPERVWVRRVRPAEGGLDARFALEPRGDGAAGWTGHVPLPRPGRWHLVVRAELPGGAVERTFRVRAP